MFPPLLSSMLAGAAVAAPGWPTLSEPPAASPARDASGDVALVIAIEDYDKAQDLPGAVANGRAWVDWLKDTAGVRTVKVLENGTATREEILAAAEALRSRAKAGGRTWVVYIGHGAPSPDGDGGMLVGVDARQTAISLEARSVRLSELRDALDGPQSEVVLVQDACFSGKTSGGDLAPGLAPLVAVAESYGPEWTVLSAGRNDEFAGPLSDGSRPAFSYLVLGALRGWGDRDGDGRVTAAEAVEYANDALFETTTGRTQRPERSGPDLLLGGAGGERGPDLTELVGSRIAAPPRTGRGDVAVGLGDGPTDFDSLAQQAAAADHAAADAARRRVQAKQALQSEKRRRLDGAAAEVQAAAVRDLAAIEDLIGGTGDSARTVVRAWVGRYEGATVTIDGTTESVAVADLGRVQEALSRMEARSTGGSYATKRVPAGRHTLGCDAGPPRCDPDEARHDVTLERDVLVGETEVTQGLYASVMGSNPAFFGGCGDTCPVEQVTWLDAVRFANALSAQDGLEACYRVDGDRVSWPKGVDCMGYRLPTEAEWEVAARGGQGYRFAGTDRADRAGWSSENSDGSPHPVGRKAPNAHGLRDMTGNVWEWTWNWYGVAVGGQVDPLGPERGDKRVVRGGSWFNLAQDLRVTNRDFFEPGFQSFYIGFRLVRTAP